MSERPPHRHNPADRAKRDAKIAKLRDQGLTLEAIAARFGLRESHVSQIVREQQRQRSEKA